MTVVEPGWYAVDPRRLGLGEVIRIAGLPALLGALIYRLTGSISDYYWLPEPIDRQRCAAEDLPAPIRSALAATLAQLEPLGLRPVAWIGRPRHVSTAVAMQAGGVLVRDDHTFGMVAHATSQHRSRPEITGARTVISLGSRDGDTVIATTDDHRGLSTHPEVVLVRRRPGPPAGLLRLHRERIDSHGRCQRLASDRETIDLLDHLAMRTAAWRIERGLYRFVGPELPAAVQPFDDARTVVLKPGPPARSG